MSTPGLKTDRFPGICRVSQYRDSTALSAHHHGDQISKRSFQPVSARPQAWRLSLDYVMSEIGRDHFLVATYEHMSLNATPTTSSLPFVLRDSRTSETQARVKITPREKRRHAAGREKNHFLFPQKTALQVHHAF